MVSAPGGRGLGGATDGGAAGGAGCARGRGRPGGRGDDAPRGRRAGPHAVRPGRQCGRRRAHGPPAPDRVPELRPLRQRRRGAGPPADARAARPGLRERAVRAVLLASPPGAARGVLRDVGGHRDHHRGSGRRGRGDGASLRPRGLAANAGPAGAAGPAHQCDPQRPLQERAQGGGPAAAAPGGCGAALRALRAAWCPANRPAHVKLRCHGHANPHSSTQDQWWHECAGDGGVRGENLA